MDCLPRRAAASVSPSLPAPRVKEFSPSWNPVSSAPTMAARTGAKSPKTRASPAISTSAACTWTRKIRTWFSSCRPPPIARAIGGGLHDENQVRIFRVHVHAADVEMAGDARVFGDLAPVRAAIVGAEETGFHDGENSLTLGAGSDGETDAAARRGRQSICGDGLPCGAFVDGFVNPGILRRSFGRTGAEIERLPERGIENARIVGVRSHVGNSGHVVLVESFVPGLAAVGRSVHAAIFAGRADAENGVAENTDDADVRVARINEDRADEARIFQADVGPAGAGIGRAVDAIAGSLFPGADDDDIGIRCGDGEVADGGYVLLVEDWFPGGAAARRFPHAAAGRAHVVGGRIAGHTCDCGNASGAVGADEAPAHGGVQAGVYDGRYCRCCGILLGVERQRGCGDDEQSRGKKALKSMQGVPPANRKVYHCCSLVLEGARIGFRWSRETQ